MSNFKEHTIISIVPESIAHELDIESGDILLAINKQPVIDMLDYRWLVDDEFVLVEVKKASGEIWELEIEKDCSEDLGLIFAVGALGEDKHCSNACVFCFVDQQPPGLRDTLYIKDDDPYQSFAMGNYITLTNLSDDDVSQIIKYKLSPMRVSVHAANMDVRCKLMGSHQAGKLFSILEKFSQAGIDMHFQVVLCKGINDGHELDYTIEQLKKIGERAQSLAVVPVGLTRYRDGLYTLKAFTKADADAVICQVEQWQTLFLNKYGQRFVFLADEWYVLAKRPMPEYCVYEDFPQLDNGVGMIKLFEDEFLAALSEQAIIAHESKPVCIGIVTGQAAHEFMIKLLLRFTESFPCITIDIHAISNEFYGPDITVSGLITGQDIIHQLKKRDSRLMMDVLFIPANAFCAGTEDMICGTTLHDISNALGVKTHIGSSDGAEFFSQLVNIR